MLTVLTGCVLFLLSHLPDKHFMSRLALGLVVCIACAQGHVSQSAMMNYDRPVTECHLGEIDSFTARAGQHLLAASPTPAVAENDFSHGLLHFLHSE